MIYNHLHELFELIPFVFIMTFRPVNTLAFLKCIIHVVGIFSLLVLDLRVKTSHREAEKYGHNQWYSMSEAEKYLQAVVLHE